LTDQLQRYGPECLNRITRGEQPPDPVLLLGAGASVKSGVPLAADLVSMAAKWGFCREKGYSFDDPNLMRSDWWPWLSKQGWFDPDQPLADQYPTAVERLLHPQESRREFFLRVLSRAERPSRGYVAMARLVAARAVRHILTVNFDDLVERACNAERAVLHVATIESPDDLVQFSLDPVVGPQVVYLHGAVARYEDRNLEDETQRLDENIREAVLPLLRDHPLVVVGYRGAEPSVMHDLLLRAAEQIHGFRHGIYWCVLRGETPGPLVAELAARLKTNFRLVEIGGFDEAMTEWAQDVRPAPAPPVATDATEPDVPDLRPADAISLDDLDGQALVERLTAYGDSMDLPRLASNDIPALEQRLEEQRLARRSGERFVLTRAAALLFAKRDVSRLEIRAGDVYVPIAGNVFSVLDQAIEAVAELNEPFRVKGPTSHDVRRFDPRAVKELLVNALAHRDHDDDRPVRVRLSPREMTVVSPGGLVGGLRPERLGEPGARAYRNPVIADLLYGCGAMDKRGSGLADVRRWARQAGGDASFGPSEDGARFVASLTTRDLDPDPVTGTADAGPVENFLANVLPIEIRASVHSADTHAAFRSEVYDAHPGEALPAFAMRPGRLFTFGDLAGGTSPLARDIVGEVETVAIESLCADPDRERLLVQLLNSTLLVWARHRGLRSDAGTQRLWFPRDEEGAREITYRARVREATRTVTKPKVSQRSGAVRYWEHEAVRFRFRRYRDQWLLHVVPCFVFTTDGFGTLLKGPRVGPLATRRIARDFNPQVQNDLFFWRWVFAEGNTETPLDNGTVWVRGEFLSRDVLDAPAATGGFGRAEEDVREDAEDISDEVAAVAAEHENDQ
jgi:hypothetical protein